MSLEVILGMGIVSFLSLYMVFKLRDSNEQSFSEGNTQGNKHFLLQLIFLFFFLGSLFFLSAAVERIDTEYCELVTTANFTYDYECFTTNQSLGTSFFISVAWLLRLSMAYIFFYFVWESLKYLGWVVPK